jgi:hypothetical protein
MTRFALARASSNLIAAIFRAVIAKFFLEHRETHELTAVNASERRFEWLIPGQRIGIKSPPARVLGGHLDVTEIANQLIVPVKPESCVLIKGEEIVQLLAARQICPFIPVKSCLLSRFGRGFNGDFATLDLVAFEFDQQSLEKSRAETSAPEAGRDKKIFYTPARCRSV